MSSLPKPKAWLIQVQDYCTALQWVMSEKFQFFLDGDAIEWHQALRLEYTRHQALPDTSKLQFEFLKQFTKTLFTDEYEARRRLHGNEVNMQKYQTYHAYELAIKAIRRDAPGMHQIDLITWFIAGLTPSLQKFTITKAPWTDLDKLMDHAKSEVMRAESDEAAYVRVNAIKANTKRRKRRRAAAVATDDADIAEVTDSDVG